MKKLILAIAILSASLVNAQSIAKKTFPKDTTTDLTGRIRVWQITIDDSAKVITYTYCIDQIVAKNSKPLSTSGNFSYNRYNQKADTVNGVPIPKNLQYNKFMNTAIGDSIKARVLKDINKMNSISDINLLEQ